MQGDCGCGGEGHGHHAQGHGALVHGARNDTGCMCGCGHHARRFISRKEKAEMLEEYRDSLKRELEGVEEALEELKKEL